MVLGVVLRYTVFYALNKATALGDATYDTGLGFEMFHFKGSVSMSELLKRRVDKILPGADELRKRMDKGPLRLYIGIDPTGGRLHIGHAIGLKKLMDFAHQGHEAILLFGTGTVLVGDPSQRDNARKRITQDEINQNIATWKKQVTPIIDFDKVTIKQNGDWITKMTIYDIIDVASNISATQLFKRESFTRRIAAGDTVWYHETMYPLLQGYDSVVMDVDLEIGGTDQEFNMLMGRELQKKINNREKFVLTTPMILGTDGQQMSKSSGNCVWLQDPPAEMFGKLMSIVDQQIIPYLELCTDVPMEEVTELEASLNSGANPRDIKLRMAEEVTAIWHDPAAAKDAREAWQAQFQQGQLPDDIAEKTIATGQRELAEVLVEVELTSSKSEARRLIDQNAVKINGDRVADQTAQINSGDLIQVGKRKFVKIN